MRVGAVRYAAEVHLLLNPIFDREAGRPKHRFAANCDGSFYDFTAELLKAGDRETLAQPPDDWGGRAANEWVEDIAAGKRFPGSTSGLLETAGTIDRLYDRDIAARASKIFADVG